MRLAFPWTAHLAATALGALLAGAVAAQDAPPADSTARPPKRVGLAVQQTLLSNVVVNRTNAWVFGAGWARDVDFETWSRNLRLGWEWDEDAFSINMFGHPYQGGLYFNAGRANGLSYAEAVPLTVFGSWTWEYFGEDLRPSLNDFFVTTLGGFAVGEVTHRVAANIRDERDRGRSRIAREVLALAVDPVGGLNRLVRGEWTRVGANPPEHNPRAFAYGAEAGVRYVYERPAVAGTRHVDPTLVAEASYGDPYGSPYAEPFDVFAVRAEVSPRGLEGLQTTGRLYQTGLPAWPARAAHALAVAQRLDYVNTPAYRFGGPSVELGVVSRFRLPRGFTLQTRLSGDALVMGAINPPEEAAGLGGNERDHDFGPGLGSKLNVRLVRRGQPVLALRSRTQYLHSVSGTPADHGLAFGDLRAALPLRGGLAVGAYVSADTRTSDYGGGNRLVASFYQTRLFVAWTNARPSAPQLAP